MSALCAHAGAASASASVERGGNCGDRIRPRSPAHDHALFRRDLVPRTACRGKQRLQFPRPHRRRPPGRTATSSPTVPSRRSMPEDPGERRPRIRGHLSALRSRGPDDRSRQHRRALNNGNLEGRVCWSAARKKIVNRAPWRRRPHRLTWRPMLVTVPAGFRGPGASYRQRGAARLHARRRPRPHGRHRAHRRYPGRCARDDRLAGRAPLSRDLTGAISTGRRSVRSFRPFRRATRRESDRLVVGTDLGVPAQNAVHRLEHLAHPCFRDRAFHHDDQLRLVRRGAHQPQVPSSAPRARRSR